MAAWEILGDFERLWEILGIFLCRFKTASQHHTVLLTVKAAMYSLKPSQYFPILLNTSQAAINRTARVCGAAKPPSTIQPAYAAPKVPSAIPPAYAAPPKCHQPAVSKAYCPGAGDRAALQKFYRQIARRIVFFFQHFVKFFNGIGPGQHHHTAAESGTGKLGAQHTGY